VYQQAAMQSLSPYMLKALGEGGCLWGALAAGRPRPTAPIYYVRKSGNFLVKPFFPLRAI